MVEQVRANDLLVKRSFANPNEEAFKPLSDAIVANFLANHLSDEVRAKSERANQINVDTLRHLLKTLIP